MKKLFTFGLMLFILGCSKTPINPKPPVEKVESEWSDASVMLDAGTGHQSDGTASYTGELYALKKDGTFASNIYSSKIDGQKLGYLCGSLVAKWGKIYLVCSNNVEKLDQSSLVILNGEDMSFVKRINFDIKYEGVPLVANSVVLVSETKAYIFFDSQVRSLNLETGVLSDKPIEIGDFVSLGIVPSRTPFYLMGDKVCGMIDGGMFGETTMIVIDTKDDSVKSYTFEDEGGVKASIVLKGHDNDLIVLSAPNAFYGGDSEFNRISTKDGKIIAYETLEKGLGMSAVISPKESALYYTGKKGTEEEKTIFKYHYETNKTEVFAVVSTKNPKYQMYQINLMINPDTEELFASVSDSYADRFVRVYDTKATKLPTTHKAEYKHNKANAILELVSNKLPKK